MEGNCPSSEFAFESTCEIILFLWSKRENITFHCSWITRSSRTIPINPNPGTQFYALNLLPLQLPANFFLSVVVIALYSPPSFLLSISLLFFILCSLVHIFLSPLFLHLHHLNPLHLPPSPLYTPFSSPFVHTASFIFHPISYPSSLLNLVLCPPFPSLNTFNKDSFPKPLRSLLPPLQTTVRATPHARTPSITTNTTKKAVIGASIGDKGAKVTHGDTFCSRHKSTTRSTHQQRTCASKRPGKATNRIIDLCRFDKGVAQGCEVGNGIHWEITKCLFFM